MPTEPFDPTKPLVVRRKFTAHGRHYDPGDRFTWKDKSIAQRIVKNLYDMGKLRHEGDPQAPRPLTEQEIDDLRQDKADAQSEARKMIADKSPYPKFYESRPAKWPPDEPVEHNIMSAVEETQNDLDTALGSDDNLDEIDDIKQLRAIAEAEGAKNARSKDDLRKNIREIRGQ